MQTSTPSTNGGTQWTTRLGFWLGLLLFIAYSNRDPSPQRNRE